VNRTVRSNDEVIAAPHHERLFRLDLYIARAARLKDFILQQQYPGQHLCCPRVQVDLDAMLHLFGPRLEEVKPGRKGSCGLQETRGAKHMAPLHIAPFDAGEVDRHPLAGLSLVDLVTMDLQAPDPHVEPQGQQFHAVPFVDGPPHQGPRDDRTEARPDKGPVHGQAGEGCHVLGLGDLQHLVKLGHQFRNALQGHAGDGKHVSLLQEGAFDGIAHVLGHQFQHVCIHQVPLGQHD